jgi:myo-inositol-1-phosphate synthase
MGAVATTFIAGVAAMRKGMAQPFGSLTQMGRIRLGKRTDEKNPLVKDFVPLVRPECLTFGGWDVYEDNSYDAACKAEVLDPKLLEGVRDTLESIRPMSAVFEQDYVKRIHGDNVKRAANKMDQAEALRDDIRNFAVSTGAARTVMVWTASTEIYKEPTAVHQSLQAFEQGLIKNDSDIAPSQIYAYAALKSGVPFANGAPNLTVDIPALQQLSRERQVAIAGKDFKTGQTLMKTLIAPGLKARLLGLEGWFSTNILGNRDGEVLDDPDNFKTKEQSKLSALDVILQPDQYPELYGKFDHKVRIEYYPPRGDNKEGWDNIDIFGWLGYPMQLKVNFLCRDSILAAPIVLDLALFMDLAQRAGMSGIQEWLSFYFKAPMTAPSLKPEHDLFIQLMKLKNTLR